MNDARHASPEQIEHEIAATRADISATLDAIQARFSPVRLLGDAFGAARGAATGAARGARTVGGDLRNASGDFATNLGQTVRENPVPVALLGIGVAWLLVAGRRAQDDFHRRYAGGYDTSVPAAWTDPVHRPPYGYAQRNADIGSDNSEGTHMTSDDDIHNPGTGSDDPGKPYRVVEGKAEAVKDTMAEIGSEVRARAAGLTENAKDTFASAQGEARRYADRAGAATREYSVRARESARDAGRSAIRFAEEHPVLVAVGLFAAGAAIASLLPRTRREDRLMGERADAAKHAARTAARDAARDAKSAAAEAVDAARESVGREKPSPEGAGAGTERTERATGGGNGWPTAH